MWGVLIFKDRAARVSVKAGLREPALRTQWMLALQGLVERRASVKCGPVVPGRKEPAHEVRRGCGGLERGS